MNQKNERLNELLVVINQLNTGELIELQRNLAEIVKKHRRK